MKTPLLEKYKNRMALAESVYAKAHNGQRMDSYRKLVTARCLENVSKFLNENFTNSVGMQRSNLGQFKIFALNLTNVVLPNLVANELVIVSPMSSWTGNVTFMNYVAGSDKGGVRRGDLFNGIYSLGQMTEDRMNYTGQMVSEMIPQGEEFFALAWTPVVGSVRLIDSEGNELVQGEDYMVGDSIELKRIFDKRLNPFHAMEDRVHQSALAGDAEAMAEQEAIIANPDSTDEEKEAAQAALDELKAKARNITLFPYNGNAAELDPEKDSWKGGYGTYASEKEEGKFAIWLNTATIDGNVRVCYRYDNVVIPQDDLPLLSAHMDSVSLQARARRIAIVFSQIAAFQAQQDYGMNLQDLLAEQAVGELSYEIDSEIVYGLADAAPLKRDLVWNRRGRIGLSIQEQYGSFAEVIEIAKAMIFKATQKFSPNYMIIAPDVLPVLSFAPQFQPAAASNVAGPYVAGTLNNLKVVVSPIMPDGQFVIGVNGNDMRTSAAVYAPYMPIVPTQLLQGPDGTTTQGFSTLYDFKILSKLPVGYKEDSFEDYKGRVSTAERPFSPLLVKGMVVGSRF